MNVNLPAYEVCTTPSMNKKSNHLIYCGCFRWISSASCEKCCFNLVSRGFFIRGSKSLIEFDFFILYRKGQKILARKGRLHAIKNVNWLLGDLGIQECWEVIHKSLLKKRHLQRKNCLHFTLLQHQILVHGRGVQVF